jgi:hypothetical protein
VLAIRPSAINLDSNRRRQQAVAELPGRRSRCRVCVDINGRSSPTARQSGATHDGRPQGLPASCRRSVWGRYQLQHVDQALRRACIIARSRAALQSVRMRRNACREHHQQSRPQARQHLLCRAGEPYDANGDGRRFTRLTNAFQQETRKPCAHGRPVCALV